MRLGVGEKGGGWDVPFPLEAGAEIERDGD